MKITDKEFDEELIKILKNISVEELLRIPGVYEILSEAFTNKVLVKIEERNELFRYNRR